VSKSPRDWLEEDILALIANGEKESLELDYKKCDSLQKTDGKKAEISKDVSAFANAAGGTLVYGIEENGHVPTGIDVGYDPNVITKEWLEQVINSTIHPRLERLYINQVELPKNRPGKVLYVVEIPQSIGRAPHQAADKRYYKRFNFESVPMEDYEIRDVMRRAQGPDLYLQEVKRQHNYRDGQGAITLGMEVGNRGRVLGKYIMCLCQIVSGSYHITPWDDRPFARWIRNQDAVSTRYRADAGIVIHPHTSLELEVMSFIPAPAAVGEILIVEFALYAEEMQPKHFRVTVDQKVPHEQAVVVEEINTP
jgi:hypothetical protein